MRAGTAVAVCAVVASVAASGCTSGTRAVKPEPPAPSSVIVGVVARCTGPAAVPPRAATVRVVQAGATVALARVLAGDPARQTFSIRVRPGRYGVEASNWPGVARHVTVSPGSSVAANFPNFCD